MPMTSQGVKKWKNFEREVARVLRKLAPSAKRCLQFQKEHGAPDVEAGVLWVECKSGQHRPVERVYRETAKKAKARKGAVAAVVTKVPRGPMLITLDLRAFVQFAKASPAIQRSQWRGKR